MNIRITGPDELGNYFHRWLKVYLIVGLGLPAVAIAAMGCAYFTLHVLSTKPSLLILACVLPVGALLFRGGFRSKLPNNLIRTIGLNVAAPGFKEAFRRIVSGYLPQVAIVGMPQLAAEIISKFSAAGQPRCNFVAVIDKASALYPEVMQSIFERGGTKLRWSVLHVADPQVPTGRRSDPASARVTDQVSAISDGGVLAAPAELTVSAEALVAAQGRLKLDYVIIALPWMDTERIGRMLDGLLPLAVPIGLLPDLGLLNRGVAAVSSRTFGIPLIPLRNSTMSRWGSLLKRAEDLILGSIALVMTLPLMLSIAIAILLDSGRPVFFRQKRIGYQGRVFEVYKFRSMTTDYLKHGELVAARSDPRVTLVGNVLRRTSLDELPQILNVLRGDMSLIGPRPHAMWTSAFKLTYKTELPNYAARHRMKPGLIGWAQIKGDRGSIDSVEKMLQRHKDDMFYIEHWSLGLDLIIIGRTILAAFSSKRAY